MNDIAGTVIAGLVVSSIIGNIVMYRQVGVLQESVTQLAKTVKALAEATEAIEARLWELKHQ